jgi:hypothetical protein
VLTLALMRWAARDWRRMNLLNRLGGAATAMLQMDIVPGLRAAAFFSVRLANAGTAHTVETTLAAGERLQRLWLTADQLGLVMHPGLATLAFAHHGAQQAPFTGDADMRLKAAKLAGDVRKLLGPIEDLIFIARIGEPIDRLARPRSIRRNLHELMISDPPDQGGIV